MDMSLSELQVFVASTGGAFGTDSKAGPPQGGWFRRRYPLWVGASHGSWTGELGEGALCPGPDSLPPPPAIVEGDSFEEMRFVSSKYLSNFHFAIFRLFEQQKKGKITF